MDPKIIENLPFEHSKVENLPICIQDSESILVFIVESTPTYSRSQQKRVGGLNLYNNLDTCYDVNQKV